MRHHIFLPIVAALVCGPSELTAASSPETGQQHTEWSVRTSLGFDALCALNLLSGDDYYLQLYPAEAAEFAAPRYARARRAAAAIKATLKDEHGEIVSAFLTLIFSGGADSTLDAVLAAARQPAGLRSRFAASEYWSAESWSLFLRVRPLIVEALGSMRQAGFVADWCKHMGTGGAARAESLWVELKRYDVLGEQERLVGRPLQGGRIDVVLLWYSMPHGIRIQGARFLTNVGYPTNVVLRNAAHEPLHPPYNRTRPDVARALATLSGDSLIARTVRQHDRSFGYTSAEGYIEEDAVQALEQVVSERLALATPAAERWRENDGGMHLLAAAIYSLMKDTGIASQGGRFDSWFVDAVDRGLLAQGEIERRAGEVVGEAAVRKWTGAAR